MKRYMTAAFVGMLVLTSCQKMSHFQVNPNNPSQSPPSLLLTYLCRQTFQEDPSVAARACRYVTYYEVPDIYIQYNWAQGGFGDYDELRQVAQMEKEAGRTGEPVYLSLAKFFKAFYYFDLTNTFGDVPFSQSMQAASGDLQPAYDNQEDIIDRCLSLLDEANSELANAHESIDGDIIFNGNTLQWRQMINAFRLRILIGLSKKAQGPGTKIKVTDLFKSIVTDPVQYPLMQSISDNGQFVFHDLDDNRYPDYNYRSMQTLYSMEKGFVDTLKKFQDPRLFSFALPVRGTPSANDGNTPRFQDYTGVDAGLTVSQQTAASPTASFIATRYYQDPVNEPYIMIGYPEQEFNIAEAIVRGWITGDASEHYYNGIKASMQFYGISQEAVNDYLAGPAVKFNSSHALDQILIQKYIACFFNSGWVPFYNQRRTGIPVFDTGAGTLNNGQVPKRWQYPQGEYDNNNANVTAAVKRQYPGGDDINGVMWLIK